MRYKLNEAEPEWRPRKRFDPVTNAWNDDPSIEYFLIDEFTHMNENPDIKKVCWAELTSSSEWKKMMKGILSCSSLPSRKWQDSHTTDWSHFFDGNDDYDLAPWVPRVEQDKQPPPTESSTSAALITLPVDNDHALELCPEPLVCSDFATAKAWGSSRRSIPDSLTSDTISVGDVICVIPDEESRAGDAALGYLLPVSFGTVISVDADSIEVGWLFASDMNAKFSPWMLSGGTEIRDRVSNSAIQRKQDGCFAKIKFTAGGKLTAASKLLVNDLLAAFNDDN